jgi:hypothetical protein
MVENWGRTFLWWGKLLASRTRPRPGGHIGMGQPNAEANEATDDRRLQNLLESLSGLEKS